MGFPSIKTLCNRLNIDRDKAKRVRFYMQSDWVHDGELPESTQEWIRSCYCRPSSDEIALHAIDVLLDNHGVEGWVNPKDMREGVSYSNTGDTYAQTVALVDWGHTYRFMVCDLEYLATRFPADYYY